MLTELPVMGWVRKMSVHLNREDVSVTAEPAVFVLNHDTKNNRKQTQSPPNICNISSGSPFSGHDEVLLKDEKRYLPYFGSNRCEQDCVCVAELFIYCKKRQTCFAAFFRNQHLKTEKAHFQHLPADITATSCLLISL